MYLTGRYGLSFNAVAHFLIKRTLPTYLGSRRSLSRRHIANFLSRMSLSKRHIANLPTQMFVLKGLCQLMK